MTRYRGFTEEDLRSSYQEYRVRRAAEGQEPPPEWEWKTNSDTPRFVEKIKRNDFWIGEE